MPCLKTIIATILQDVVEAQALVGSPGNGQTITPVTDRLSSVPGSTRVIITEVELELKFAVRELALAALTPGPHAPAVQKALDDYGASLARIIASQAASIFERTEELVEHKATWQQLAQNILSPTFLSYLGQGVTCRLRDGYEGVFDKDLNVRVDAALPLVMAAIEELVFGHPDLAPIFRPGSRVRKEFYQFTQKAAESGLRNLRLPGDQGAELPTVLQADAIIESNQLQDLPDNIISYVKVKARLSGQSITSTTYTSEAGG